MALYSKVEYWNGRYLETASGPPCEWYSGYKGLSHLLNSSLFVPKLRGTFVKAGSCASVAETQQPPQFERARVLILGCGNSTLGEDLVRNGWKGGIVNVDFSEVVINQMKAKYGESFYSRARISTSKRLPMEFICADITKPLSFADESFDLIICKGTLDAILCGLSSKIAGARLVAECARLLRRGYGILFLVTHGNPDNRIELLEHQGNIKYYWQTVNVHLLPQDSSSGEKSFYVYVCRKRMDPQLETITEKENFSENLSDVDTNDVVDS